MNVRKLVALVIVIIITATLGYVAVAGVAFGIYEIKPLPEQIKKGLDLTGGVSCVYEAKNPGDPDLAEKMSMALTIFRKRLDSEGYTEATIQMQGSNRIRIEIPINNSQTVSDPRVITEYLVKTAKVEFVDPDNNVVFEGKDMESVNVVTDENGEYAVAFKLKSDAAQRFAEATAKYLKQAIAIYVDREENPDPISTPTVNSVISGGEGEISGNYTADSARLFAQQIQSGVLPLEMREIEVRSISATLGEDALTRGIQAGIIGICLVFVFMALYYRLPGLMADLALIIYMIIMLFALATIPGVQLTLPGIAGIILSIGMAVDANVVIFERMREELRNGKSIRSAVKSGFNRAFSAILDSNITTIIAAVVLLFFGTGPIKGFALTLLIGIILSFITAVFVTRGLLNIMLGLGVKNPSLFMQKPKTPAADAEAK